MNSYISLLKDIRIYIPNNVVKTFMDSETFINLSPIYAEITVTINIRMNISSLKGFKRTLEV
jgi:hypothetical protein